MDLLNNNFSEEITVFWFRRDLRLDDNHGLFKALSENTNVLPIFIFDTNIAAHLPENDHRITLIYNRLKELNNHLTQHFNKQIVVFKNNPQEVFEQLINAFKIKNVYTNEDYEPYAQDRDRQIKKLLRNSNIPINFFTDQVIFSPHEISTNSNGVYKVFTPFSKKWLYKFNTIQDLPHYPSENYLTNFLSIKQEYQFPSLETLGFKESALRYSVPQFDKLKQTIKNYHLTRDVFELDNGTTHVSTALRFGLLSIRKLVNAAKINPVYLNELIWREFFQHIIYHFPNSAMQNFKNINIPVENNVEMFEKWKNAQTGYFLIDAAINQLNKTGYMHNRLRMLTANFLCKILWVDWRWGERYFAEKLFDFELASNSGNWQWASGTGVDSAPYFRIFNPESQLKKFDPNNKFITKWLPYNLNAVPNKIVDYSQRRQLYLNMMKK